MSQECSLLFNFPLPSLNSFYFLISFPFPPFVSSTNIHSSFSSTLPCPITYISYTCRSLFTGLTMELWRKFWSFKCLYTSLWVFLCIANAGKLWAFPWFKTALSTAVFHNNLFVKYMNIETFTRWRDRAILAILNFIPSTCHLIAITVLLLTSKHLHLKAKQVQDFCEVTTEDSDTD
jgi:hypothetical protein